MVQTTSPDFINKWTNGDPTSIVQASQSQGDSVQTALNKRQRFDFVWPTSTERTAQTGMTQGSRGYQLDTKSDYMYDNSAWRLTVSYARYTLTTQSIPTSSTWTLMGSASLDTTQSTDLNFVSYSSGKVTVVNPGLYSVSAFFVYSTSWSGRRFMDLHLGNVAAGDVGSQIMRGASSGLDNTVNFSMPNLRVTTANQIYTLDMYQDSGGSVTYTGTMNWTRIA